VTGSGTGGNGAGEQRGWHGEAERLGGCEIDDKLELGRLFDRDTAFVPPIILSTNSAARWNRAALRRKFEAGSNGGRICLGRERPPFCHSRRQLLAKSGHRILAGRRVAVCGAAGLRS
jgi:hypothetical protein